MLYLLTRLIASSVAWQLASQGEHYRCKFSVRNVPFRDCAHFRPHLYRLLLQTTCQLNWPSVDTSQSLTPLHCANKQVLVLDPILGCFNGQRHPLYDLSQILLSLLVCFRSQSVNIYQPGQPRKRSSGSPCFPSLSIPSRRTTGETTLYFPLLVIPLVDHVLLIPLTYLGYHGHLHRHRHHCPTSRTTPS